MIDIKSATSDELATFITNCGVPAFRAKQIKKWLDAGAATFDEMTDLPLGLRQKLKGIFCIPSAVIRRKLISRDGTVKYLFAFADGETVESVLMTYKYGVSQCLSTQVGCRMGCIFCATGMSGFSRNLSSAEMLAQIEAAQDDGGLRVSSLVLMGMGEPLDNYDNVLRFLRMLSEPGGVHIGMRHVSLSTCGLVDKIYCLMEEKLQLTLSVSLHAPNDEIRMRTMPVAKRWPLAELLKAGRDYADATGRRVSYEYAMIDGLNDSDACASELAAKLKGTLCHVNLIPVNPVAGTGHKRSSGERIQNFSKILEAVRIPVTVRRNLGSDIRASCGQLKSMND